MPESGTGGQAAGRDDRLRLAELLATRLCHDLSGPLGTLMGSLEMLAEDPESAEEALTLAGEVAAILGGRLRLLRAAWAGGTPALGVAEFRAMAEGLKTRRLLLDFDGLDAAGQFSPPAARVALNLLMLAADCLPVGGTVSISGDPRRDLVVTIDGPRAAWPAGFAGFLHDDARAWVALRESEGVEASRRLQAPLTALIARSCGVRLSLLMAAAAEAAPPLLMQMG
jgi:histidine phosphotransferase ChpT